jgi:uroporphyrinogen-III synthase
VRVLITRPVEDSGPLIADLKARGIEALMAPLLEIEFIDGPQLNLVDVQALLMTSANGVRAFARRSENRKIKVMAVGDATARVAREMGFIDVQSASGDVDDLAAKARQLLDSAGGSLLHPAGSKVAGNLAGLLMANGFSYRREVLYRASTADTLPIVAAHGLENDDFAGVLLYSPRTGTTFKRLVEAAGLGNKLATVRAYCLSANVAGTVAGLPWAEILTAARPEQAALLDLFDET